MEEIRAYIESGMLELYVLGDLSPSEKSQVEEMASMYPEIKAEIAAIESSLEAYALQNAVEPSAGLRDKVLNSLVTNFADDKKFPTTTFSERELEEEQTAQYDNVRALPTARPNSFYKYAFAASLAALIVSLGALYNTNSKLNDTQTQIAQLQTKNQAFANQVNYMDKTIKVIQDPANKIINLQGTKVPSSKMMLAWNPVKKSVVVDMRDLKLAANDAEHQYQLWAIVDGKPVDLGVFDAKADNEAMVEMKSVANATLFAVTLEKRGGSPTPHLDQMVLASSKII